ncbi:pentraxin-related protein PTX3 [Syngnathus scovelli]|uniref:pentraxin-related protein PTX3 n=1 Tax=Syngnathus scovelli TaxID=161590 RepID=UPI002110D29E|nr:pentraxin-related protein PTX3 [Syngnathus scovelli]
MDKDFFLCSFVRMDAKMAQEHLHGSPPRPLRMLTRVFSFPGTANTVTRGPPRSQVLLLLPFGPPQKMCALRIWGLLCMISCAGGSPYLNQVDYVDLYDNEVSREQHGEDSTESQTSCQSENLLRWDKLFIALENSHMRQNMLLESSESCCGAMTSLRVQMEHLARTASRQCPSWQAALKLLRQDLLELREEGEARERRFNATLQTYNRSKASPSGVKEQDVTQGVTSPPADSVERALVAIATELQKLHVQLGRVIQQAGALRKERGNS